MKDKKPIWLLSESEIEKAICCFKNNILFNGQEICSMFVKDKGTIAVVHTYDNSPIIEDDKVVVR